MIKISAKTRQFRGSPRHWGRGPRRRVVQPLAAAAAAAVVTVATEFSPPQPPLAPPNRLGVDRPPVHRDDERLRRFAQRRRHREHSRYGFKRCAGERGPRCRDRVRDRRGRQFRDGLGDGHISDGRPRSVS